MRPRKPRETIDGVVFDRLHWGHETCPSTGGTAIGTDTNGATAELLTSAFDGNSVTHEWLVDSADTAPGCGNAHLQCSLTQFPGGFAYEL